MANYDNMVASQVFKHPTTLAGGRIEVYKNGRQFIIDTWLPVGMNWSRDYPEFRDRAEDIFEARRIYGERAHANFTSKGYCRIA